MHGREGNLPVRPHDFFRAIAVMSVDIPNGDARRASRKRVESCDGDMVEITKTHRALARGVVAWRPHETEGRLTSERGLRAIDRSAGRARGMRENVGVSWRVRVEILSAVLNSGDVFIGVRAPQRGKLRGSRRLPLPVGVAFTQPRCGSRDAGGTLWMSARRIRGGERIVQDEHRSIVRR